MCIAYDIRLGISFRPFIVCRNDMRQHVGSIIASTIQPLGDVAPRELPEFLEIGLLLPDTGEKPLDDPISHQRKNVWYFPSPSVNQKQSFQQ